LFSYVAAGCAQFIQDITGWRHRSYWNEFCCGNQSTRWRCRHV